MRLLPGESITAEKPRVTGRVHGRALLRQPGRLLPGGGCYQGGGMTAAREGHSLPKRQGDCCQGPREGVTTPLSLSSHDSSTLRKEGLSDPLHNAP